MVMARAAAKTTTDRAWFSRCIISLLLCLPQCERHVLAAAAARTLYRDDNVLLPVSHVRHWRTALLSRHQNRADFLAGLLVICAQHRAARAIRRRRDLRIPDDNERLCN